jgi:hypothetical protein
MKKTKFTESQIVGILKEQEEGIFSWSLVVVDRSLIVNRV